MGRPRTLSGVLAATLIGVVSGCGLPDPRPLLPPPSAPGFSDTADTFSFSQPTGAGSDRVPGLETFGYEVYYRFSAIGAATDRNLADLTQLRGNGFVSLRKADDRHPLAATARPLIEVPSAARAEHRVTLSFVALEEAGADPDASLSSGGRISMRRGVEDTFTGWYRRFACEEFESDHPDVEAYPELPEDCAAGLAVQLQLYAVAYGRDAERYEQFSEPLYLGSINVTFSN